jgi:pyruvate dehydrogenase E1 component alpha subunit
MDVLTVYEEMQKIAKEVREDSLPWFVEIRTYRYRGHSMSDPQKYRSKEELEEYQNVDPIERLKTYILDKKIADDKEIEELQEKVENTILEARMRHSMKICLLASRIFINNPCPSINRIKKTNQ